MAFNKTLKKIKIWVFFLILLGIISSAFLYRNLIESFLENAYFNFSNHLGFSLKKVNYNQQVRWCKDIQELDLLGDNYKKPIFSVTIDDIRKNLEHIDCIDKISIKRILPDTIEINVTEKIPVVIWQNRNKFFYITENGEIVNIYNPEEIESFIILVGKNAFKNFKILFEIISNNEELKKNITSAIYVGNRRWNIRFSNGIEILLPEENPEIAWQKFVTLAKKHNLLEDSNYKIYDFRIANKMIVK